MTVKVSQLTELTNIANGNLFLVLDTSIPGSPVSKKAQAVNIQSFILNGNAASATKLQTARTINGVPFDGTHNISITTAVPDASDTTKGLVLIPVESTSGITNNSGTIGLAISTNTQLGGVKIGPGINIAVDGTISGPVRKFHGFSVNSTGDLIYSTTQDTTIVFQDQYGADIYEDTDIGTDEYSYSMDADGNLIVTFS